MCEEVCNTIGHAAAAGTAQLYLGPRRPWESRDLWRFWLRTKTKRQTAAFQVHSALTLACFKLFWRHKSHGDDVVAIEDKRMCFSPCQTCLHHCSLDGSKCARMADLAQEVSFTGEGWGHGSGGAQSPKLSTTASQPLLCGDHATCLPAKPRSWWLWTQKSRSETPATPIASARLTHNRGPCEKLVKSFDWSAEAAEILGAQVLPSQPPFAAALQLLQHALLVFWVELPKACYVECIQSGIVPGYR